MKWFKTLFDNSGVRQATQEEIANVNYLLDNQINFIELNADQLNAKKLKSIIDQCYVLLRRLQSLDPPKKNAYLEKLITSLQNCKSRNDNRLIQETSDHYLTILEKK